MVDSKTYLQGGESPVHSSAEPNLNWNKVGISLVKMAYYHGAPENKSSTPEDTNQVS
jgi:hypothetical protein